MSLLDDFARTCVLLEKTLVPDDAGGYSVAWSEGEGFEVYYALDSSTEARRAELERVASDYSALVSTSVPIKYDDVFRDTSTGRTFRVTSNPTDKVAPASSTFDLMYFAAERWELTE